MSTEELSKKLEELYLTGLLKGWFLRELLERRNEVFWNRVNITSEKIREIESVERALFGKSLGYEAAFRCGPFQNAMKVYEEFKNSPLMKALE